MSQNASGGLAPLDSDDPVVARAARRALARRQAVYSDEVRRLLDAGLEVMRRCGTTRTPRVADILESAGLSRDAFYRHFESKEELVAAILEAGTHRLVGYLNHLMDKESDPAGKLRRWVEGIMAQAADPEVAHTTRAVVWNGGHVGDRSRPDAVARYAPLAELIVEPISQLGSSDPARDSALLTYAAMGWMQEFLWRCVTPSSEDTDHLVSFCMATLQPR
jgi:AcrR family transcriptional regulator